MRQVGNAPLTPQLVSYLPGLNLVPPQFQKGLTLHLCFLSTLGKLSSSPLQLSKIFTNECRYHKNFLKAGTHNQQPQLSNSLQMSQTPPQCTLFDHSQHLKSTHSAVLGCPHNFPIPRRSQPPQLTTLPTTLSFRRRTNLGEICEYHNSRPAIQDLQIQSPTNALTRYRRVDDKNTTIGPKQRGHPGQTQGKPPWPPCPVSP